MASLRALDGESISQAGDSLLAQQVAGIAILAPVATPDRRAGVDRADLPLVLIDAGPDIGRSVVSVDQVLGARLATEHLLGLGHETVWHVSGPPGWFDSMGRVEGWRHALEDAGREVPPLLPADWTAAAGYDAGQVIARMPDVTAVFAANDHLALGILRALGERGRRVPEDVSVVGFDDVPESAYFRPPLTTVRQDFAHPRPNGPRRPARTCQRRHRTAPDDDPARARRAGLDRAAGRLRPSAGLTEPA